MCGRRDRVVGMIFLTVGQSWWRGVCEFPLPASIGLRVPVCLNKQDLGTFCEEGASQMQQEAPKREKWRNPIKLSRPQAWG